MDQFCKNKPIDPTTLQYEYPVFVEELKRYQRIVLNAEVLLEDPVLLTYPGIFIPSSIRDNAPRRRAKMKKSRYNEEQIVRILRETDRDSVSTVAKRHGVTEIL